MDTTAHTALRHFLEALSPIPDSEWTWLLAHIRPFRTEKRHTLIAQGERVSHLWFLCEGVLRFYYITDQGKEFNKAFSQEGELVGALVPLATNTASTYFIETLTPVSGLQIDSRIFPAIFDRHVCWERIGRKLAEFTALRKEIRERELLITDAHARYQSFLQRYPGLIARIPQKQIAAYIGITEVALSRLLNNPASSA